MGSPCRTVFALPELLELIAGFLDPSDRLHLALTSRFLHQTVTPVVWSTLSLNNDQARQFKRSAHAYKLLETHLHCVRQVSLQANALFLANCMIRYQKQHAHDQTKTTVNSIHSTGLYSVSNAAAPSSWLDSLALPHMPQLVGLHFSTYESIQPRQDHLDREYSESSALPRLTWLIKHHTTLTYLRVSVARRIKNFIYPHMLIQPILSLTSLKEVDFFFQMSSISWVTFVQSVFDRLPASVEVASLRVHTRREVAVLPYGSYKGSVPGLDIPPKSSEPVRRLVPLDRLKTLRVDFGQLEDVGLLCSLLENCPAMEIFSVPVWRENRFRPISLNLAKAVTKYCPRLRSLDNCSQAAVDIVDVLRPHTLTNLGNDQFCSAYAVDSILQMVSANQHRSITEIRIVNAPHISGSVAQAILWNCAALQHLIIRGCHSPVATRLKHLVEREWVCRGLMTLEITVELRQVITFAADMCSMPGVHDPTWIMLQKFYRQLGALSEIKVLNLGIKSKEMQWLETTNGWPRLAVGRKPCTRLRQGTSMKGDDDDDDWSADDNDIYAPTISFKTLRAINADASFPGLLSLGNGDSGGRARPGFLTWLGGLKHLRELRGHVQATTTETIWTVGQKEMEWMLEHWPALKVIELLPALKDRHAQPRDLLPVNMSLPHILWFQEQRPDIDIHQPPC